MKSNILCFVFFLFASGLFAQEAEDIYSITKVQKDYKYYSEQAKLWEKIVEESPTDNRAWLNYFIAARMNNIMAGADGSRYDLEIIANDLKTALPNSYEYYYVSFKMEPDMDKAFGHIKKAYAMDPNRYLSWDAFINKAEFEGDKKTMKTFFEKWYQHRLYSHGLTTWNYNVLVGLKEDAVLMTFGDNDTYPIWFLQTVKNIRTDVRIVHASLIMREDYRAKVFGELGIPAFEKNIESFGDYVTYRDALMEHIATNVKNNPVYIGIAAPRSFTKKYDEKLFLVGLAYEYSESDFDHIAVIRKNYEQLFLKDYLKVDIDYDFCQSVVDHMNQQYIPALTVLYKHYILSEEDSKAKQVKDVLMRIGEKNKKLNEINSFLTKFKNVKN